MPSYLIETYLARGATDERARRERAASEAAEALTRAGMRVRFGGSINVPDDEICFLSFEAESDREVTLVAERAGLERFRVVQAEFVLSWLREDAHKNAERVLLRALDEVDTTPQRRS